MIVTLATVLFVLSATVASWLVWSIGDLRAAGEAAKADELLSDRLPLLAAAPILGLVALVLYAAWISRVVDNLPALGAGYSSVGATMACFEPLIPGLNLYALPARAGEVIRKMETGSRGLALIGLGWILGFGPVAIGAWVLRFGRFTETGAELLRTIGLTLLAMFAFQATALVIGLFVIWHVERLCRARATAARQDRAA